MSVFPDLIENKQDRIAGGDKGVDVASALAQTS